MRRHVWKQQLANERGAVLVLVTMSLVMLLGVAAVAIDLGMLYDARNDAQKTADAAALAGASVFVPPGMPENQEVAEATRRALEIGGMNAVQGRAVSPGEMQVQVVQNQQLVRVTVRRAGIPLWFARIFGRDTGVATARAAAAVPMSGSVECLRPLGFADLWHERTGDNLRYTATPAQMPCAWGTLGCDFYEPLETGRGMWWRNAGMPGPDGKGLFEAPAVVDDVGRQITFYQNDQTGNFDVGAADRLFRNRYYTLRTPGCNGGNCWRDGLAGDVCTGTISIGDSIYTEPGGMPGPTDQGLARAYNADPGASWDVATNTIRGSRYPLGCSGNGCTGEGSPRVFNVGMVSPAERILANASAAFEIKNFGAYFLEAWGTGGSGNWIRVRWMKPKAVADNCQQRGNCRANLQLPLRLVE